MRDACATLAKRPRPRWHRLYAIAVLVVAAVAFADLAVDTPWLRIALDGAVAAVGWGAAHRWVRANRVALDQLGWCEEAARTIAVRVIRSSPLRSVGPAPSITPGGGVVDMRESGRRRRRRPRPVPS